MGRDFTRAILRCTVRDPHDGNFWGPSGKNNHTLEEESRRSQTVQEAINVGGQRSRTPKVKIPLYDARSNGDLLDTLIVSVL